MEELLEKDFIAEKKGKRPFVVSLYMGFFLCILLLSWGGVQWVSLETKQLVRTAPFLRVTNREYSLFLWQHTEYMRPHRKQKTGYLPGFRLAPHVTPKGEKAEEWVAAPPELLFEYQAWKRLLGRQSVRRVISPDEFRQFLDEAEEWHPRFWKQAPFEYQKLVEMLDTLKETDIRSSLPREVQQSFLGWKNYFLEGELINAFRPTQKELEVFLEKHPYYARHYWRNLYPDYLKESGGEIEIPSFLRLALYNFYSKP